MVHSVPDFIVAEDPKLPELVGYNTETRTRGPQQLPSLIWLFLSSICLRGELSPLTCCRRTGRTLGDYQLYAHHV